MERKRQREIIIKELEEATWSRGYPDDGTGISTDDDRPPGNILLGTKYKPIDYFNRLTTFSRNWEMDNGNWKWDHFEMAGGMEDYDNYSQTIKSLEKILPSETWDNIWKHMTQVPDREVTKDFAKAGQPHRDASTQLGKDKEDSVVPPEEVQLESLLNRIDILTM